MNFEFCLLHDIEEVQPPLPLTTADTIEKVTGRREAQMSSLNICNICTFASFGKGRGVTYSFFPLRMIQFQIFNDEDDI
jgi:hypothetical protein